MSKNRENLPRKLFDADVVDYLFRITLKDKNRVITRDFSADVSIDYDLLLDELIECPSIYAFWSSVLAKQKLNVDILKRQITALKAKIKKEYIDASKTGNIKITKYQLDELADSDEKINELSLKLALEESRYSALFGVVDALRIKSDNIRSLAGFKRQEMKDSQ